MLASELRGPTGTTRLRRPDDPRRRAAPRRLARAHRADRLQPAARRWASAGGRCTAPAPPRSTWSPPGSLRPPTPRPLVTLRVVLDTSRRELHRPLRTLTGAATAYRALRRACSLVEEWANALAPREVVLASPRASCAGVERAVEIVERVARGSRRTGLRAQADRPQRPRRRIARGARRGLRRRARRGAGGRDRDLLGPRRLAGGAR